jgi:hypothetical protein
VTDKPLTKRATSAIEKIPQGEVRDVLATRIAKWADTDDWHVYDYVDRLLADLDGAGFQVLRKGTEGDEQTAEDYHDPDNEMGPESWIGEALWEFREFDAEYLEEPPDGRPRSRMWCQENIVNAIAPQLIELGRADTLGFVSDRIHGSAPIVAWVSPPDPDSPFRRGGDDTDD